mmetsp:Transcript_846/g.889  ORF Transcript_846/g.889 Transcript_846/m.889 type:complete len:261 (-) Transcript_846:19-801(-)|eukprot:CAMPEP_0115007626 /NCGR_PEP_ID=MMETSP0216-20121206/21318_1 /TAXON_ID=223996 /ORGANISM="Protocruzia adherens, Strain Boccale" /LENGTH=260 /DNA_ID=CAMNT_0002374657 /DNA_START=48 /DNA_END=830 /DNA_ORIENTATION=+
MGNSNTKSLVGLGLGTVAIAGLLWWALKEDETPEETKRTETRTPAKATASPGLDLSGGEIQTKDLLKIITLIRERCKGPMTELKMKSREERKANLEDMVVFKSQVEEFYKKQEEILEGVTQEIFQEAGTTEEKFDMAVQQNMGNPEVMFAIQQMGVYVTNVDTGKITKEKLFEIFDFHISRLDESKGDLSQNPQDFFIMHTKISDEIYHKFGIEEDQILLAVNNLNLRNTPEFTNYTSKLRELTMPGMMSMGGGMGMPGM